MSAWAAILAASLGCYGLKLAGLSLPESVLANPRVQRIAALLPVAMLSALVASGLLTSGRHYALDWRLLAGVATGAVALWRGALPARGVRARDRGHRIAASDHLSPFDSHDPRGAPAGSVGPAPWRATHTS